MLYIYRSFKCAMGDLVLSCSFALPLTVYFVAFVIRFYKNHADVKYYYKRSGNHTRADT